MPRRKGADRELGEKFGAALQKLIDGKDGQRGLKKAVVARKLGVSRPTLYSYLSGDTTPGADVLATALEEWEDLDLAYKRYPLTKDLLQRPQPDPKLPTPRWIQGELFTKQQQFSNSDESVTVKIGPRSERDPKTFQILLQLDLTS